MGVQGNSMQGKVCLVTGATGGIGKVTARVLAERGATVYIVGRNRAKCEAAVEQIRAQTGNRAVEYLMADLSSLKQVRALAAEFKTRSPRLDVLVNNVGAYIMTRHESVDGIELTFALNHLGVFLLTDLLLDTLKASAPSRIVTVSSGAHYGGKLDFDDVQERKGYGFGWRAYAQSKLANVLFTYELARRLQGTGVTANTLHPGFVASNFAKNNGPLVRLAMPVLGLFAISVEEGAQTTIALATDPALAHVTGKYFNKCKPVHSSKASYDEESARRLWQMSEEMVRQT